MLGSTLPLRRVLITLLAIPLVVLDCDLQDDPMYIPKLVEKFKDGCDVVYTIKDTVVIHTRGIWVSIL